MRAQERPSQKDFIPASACVAAGLRSARVRCGVSPPPHAAGTAEQPRAEPGAGRSAAGGASPSTLLSEPKGSV